MRQNDGEYWCWMEKGFLFNNISKKISDSVHSVGCFKMLVRVRVGVIN